MVSLKGATGVVLLEEVRGQHGEFHNLDSALEVEQVMGILVRNLGKDMYYRLWRTEGPERTGVVHVALGFQVDQKKDVVGMDEHGQAFNDQQVVEQGLESLPVQTVAIRIHALLMTLNERFENYQRGLLNPESADNWR